MKKIFYVCVICIAMVMTACGSDNGKIADQAGTKHTEDVTEINNRKEEKDSLYDVENDTDTSKDDSENENKSDTKDSAETMEDNSNNTDISSNGTDNSSNTDTEENNSPENNASEALEAEKSYYGKWKVSAYITTASVSALTTEEINELVGTNLTYEENSFSWNNNADGSMAGNVCSEPSYQEETITAESFLQDYRQSFDNLGISAGEAAMVFIDSDFFGNIFLVKDENTLIICYEGVFFEAVRSEM